LPQKKRKKILVLIFEKERIPCLYRYGFNIDLKKRYMYIFFGWGREYKASQFKKPMSPLLKIHNQ
jgi:hypothetical protein